MSLQEYIALITSPTFWTDSVTMTWAALLAFAIVFFITAVGFSTAAIRSARRADNLRAQAQDMLNSVQNYTVEVRQLAAQTERASLRASAPLEAGDASASLSDRINSVRVGDTPAVPYASAEPATESTTEASDEASEETISTSESTGESEQQTPALPAEPQDGPDMGDLHADETDAVDADSARLADATRAASEPRSLLASILRRK